MENPNEIIWNGWFGGTPILGNLQKNIAFPTDSCRSIGCELRQLFGKGPRVLIINMFSTDLAVCQNLVPLVNIKIAGKWMFIPLKMVLIGIDP